MSGISNKALGADVMNAIDDLAELELRNRETGAVEAVRKVVGPELENLGLNGEREILRLLQTWRSLKDGAFSDESFAFTLDRFPSLRSLDQVSARERVESVAMEVRDIAANLHQAKARTSYLNGVIRPLADRWILRFRDERTDIDFDAFEAGRGRLLAMNIEGVEDVTAWADKAFRFFESHMVVSPQFRIQYGRLPGTVSISSERIYRQYWTTFCADNAERIFKYACSLHANPRTRFKGASGPIGQRFELQLGRFSAAAGAGSEPRVQSTTSEPPAQPEPSETIRVTLRSSIDPMVVATREWNEREAARADLAGWLLQFELLWGKHAQKPQITVEVITPTGTSNIALPAQPLEEAAKTLPGAVTRL